LPIFRISHHNAATVEPARLETRRSITEEYRDSSAQERIEPPERAGVSRAPPERGSVLSDYATSTVSEQSGGRWPCAPVGRTGSLRPRSARTPLGRIYRARRAPA